MTMVRAIKNINEFHSNVRFCPFIITIIHGDNKWITNAWAFSQWKKLVQCHKHLHAICASVFRFQWATHPSSNVQVLKNCKNVHFALMNKITQAVNCYCWSLQEIVLASWMQCFYEVSGIVLKNPVIRQGRQHTVSMHLDKNYIQWCLEELHTIRWKPAETVQNKQDPTVGRKTLL